MVVMCIYEVVKVFVLCYNVMLVMDEIENNCQSVRVCLDSVISEDSDVDGGVVRDEIDVKYQVFSLDEVYDY